MQPISFRSLVPVCGFEPHYDPSAWRAWWAGEESNLSHRYSLPLR